MGINDSAQIACLVTAIDSRNRDPPRPSHHAVMHRTGRDFTQGW